LAQDGSQKFMNTLRDALLGYHEQQAFVAEMITKSSWLEARHKNTQDGTGMVALALATFMRYAVGIGPQGETLILEDPLAEVLRPMAARAYKASDGRRPQAVERADRLDATRCFLRTIFGDEVAAWDAFVHNVAMHAEAIQNSSCRVVLRQCRHTQLRTIRSDIAECEAKLKELHKSEKLLTTQSERDAAARFYDQSQADWATGLAPPSTQAGKAPFPRVQTFSN